MWNWIAAFGVLIELFGFGTLAYELWQTSKAEIIETAELSKLTSAFDRITVFDGPEGHASIEGGVIGRQLEALKAGEIKLRERMILIARGAIISAIGCVLQVVGSFGQALGLN